jgi:hypothetical protein
MVRQDITFKNELDRTVKVIVVANAQQRKVTALGVGADSSGASASVAFDRRGDAPVQVISISKGNSSTVSAIALRRNPPPPPPQVRMDTKKSFVSAYAETSGKDGRVAYYELFENRLFDRADTKEVAIQPKHLEAARSGGLRKLL